MFQFLDDVLWHENYDLSNTVTPIKHEVLDKLLRAAQYDEVKTQYLVSGFKEGFKIHCQGNVLGKRFAPNLKIRIGSKLILWNKVMKEVEAGRYAGPYLCDDLPFKDFIQSPIGLVPKDKGTKTRLIFHLSYPKHDNTSVNARIPKHYCSVAYPDFDQAVKLCVLAGKNAKMGRSDMSMAFRQDPLRVEQFNLMILKATHPKTGVTYFFADKALPFGCAESCAIFQAISDGIAFLVMARTNKVTINYLDDYFFVAWFKKQCDLQVAAFLTLCQEICFPVSIEKTFWGTTLLTFLGFLLDSERQMVLIPVDKIQKALESIQHFLNPKQKKTTVLRVKKLCGLLNFLGRCVIPGEPLPIGCML